MPVEPDGDEPEETGWQCADCGTPRSQLTRQCRVCAAARRPSAKTTAAPVTRSVVETDAEVAKLQQGIAGLKACEAGPALKAAIAVMQAKIDCLMKPAAPSHGPDLTAQLGAAQRTVIAAEARVAALTDRGDGLRARIAGMQKDQDALAQASSKAQQHHREAEAALASVQQAVGAQAPGPGPATTPAAQTAPPCSAHATFMAAI